MVVTSTYCFGTKLHDTNMTNKIIMQCATHVRVNVFVLINTILSNDFK